MFGKLKKMLGRDGIGAGEMKAAYEAYQGLFFEGSWLHHQLLGRAMVAWARDAYPAHFERCASSRVIPDVILETTIRDEEGPGKMTAFLEWLPSPLRADAIEGIARDIRSMAPASTSLLARFDAAAAALRADHASEAKVDEAAFPPWQSACSSAEPLALFLPQSVVEAIRARSAESGRALDDVVSETFRATWSAIEALADVAACAPYLEGASGPKIKLKLALSGNIRKAIEEEAARLDRSPAWIVGLAWMIAAKGEKEGG